MGKFKNDFSSMRSNFHKKVQSVESEASRNQLYGGDEKGGKQLREKLLNNQQELYDQENQLDNIKKLGLEANDNMKEANKGLRDQRDII